MNNAVFGKTLENLRKRINLKLTSNEDIDTKHASRANFISDPVKCSMKIYWQLKELKKNWF